MLPKVDNLIKIKENNWETVMAIYLTITIKILKFLFFMISIIFGHIFQYFNIVILYIF